MLEDSRTEEETAPNLLDTYLEIKRARGARIYVFVTGINWMNTFSVNMSTLCSPINSTETLNFPKPL